MGMDMEQLIELEQNAHLEIKESKERNETLKKELETETLDSSKKNFKIYERLIKAKDQLIL